MKINKIFIGFIVLLVCVLGYGLYSSNKSKGEQIYETVSSWHITTEYSLAKPLDTESILFFWHRYDFEKSVSMWIICDD